MPLSLSALESLFRLGRFKDLLSELRTHGELTRLSPEQALLFADVLVRTGSPEQASGIATRIAQQQLAPSVRAHSEFVLGLIARESGNSQEAIRRLQLATKTAEEEGEFGKAAMAAVTAYRTLSERYPPEVIRPFLAELRTLTTHAGDPHLSARLHESVARQETQAGNIAEARRHLRLAIELVREHPNAWLEQDCAISAFCIEFSVCNFSKAREHLEHAAGFISQTGSFEKRIANNLGHLHLQLGNAELSHLVLTTVIDGSKGDLLQCGLEGRARALLSLGRLSDCERDLDHLDRVHSLDGSVASFALRASFLTRARVHLKQQQWPLAVSATERAIKEGGRVRDANLVSTAQFLRGVALVGLGDLAEAARAIYLTKGQFGREYLDVLNDLSAESLVPNWERLRSLYVDRAARIRAVHAGSQSQSARQPQSKDFGTPHEGMVSVLSGVAHAFEFCDNPRLLGAELVALANGAIVEGCAKVISVRAINDNATRNDESVLALGTDGPWQVLLKFETLAEPVKALQMVYILRLARAIIELGRHREEALNRTALWPADPVEAQHGSIFVADEMRTLLASARRIASTNVPVLITGETGTGKEVLARTIHALSNRAKSPFLPFNCTSTPRDMLDSQLFGHRRGSFTGATEHFPGVIRAAAGGTLFLDEIGDMGLEVQPKILRFLEAGEVHPIGETQPRSVDVRVIAATNVPLDALVSAGRFRDDLFYRLNIVHLHVPPLRERRVEIPTLAHHYLQTYAQECRKGDLRLAEDTMEYLVLYRWPGNVRQLANEMRRMAALAETGAVLMPEHLSSEIAASRRTIPASQRTLDATEVVVRLDQPLPAAIQHLERAMLQYALTKTGGRMEDTAALLGVSRKGLYLKRQRFGIEPPRDGQIDVA